MNYYHLTADIDPGDEDEIQIKTSPSLEDEEPNWLIVSPGNVKSPQKPPSSTQPSPSNPQPPAKVRLRSPKQNTNLSHRISARLSQFLWTNSEEASSSVDVNAVDYEHLPSGSKVNNEDPVAQKISEIFGSFHNGSEANSETGHATAATAAAAEQSLPAQPRQRRRRSNPLRQHRLRHLNTVSGYFNDWTQWLTSNEASTING